MHADIVQISNWLFLDLQNPKVLSWDCHIVFHLQSVLPLQSVLSLYICILSILAHFSSSSRMFDWSFWSCMNTTITHAIHCSLGLLEPFGPLQLFCLLLHLVKLSRNGCRVQDINLLLKLVLQVQ